MAEINEKSLAHLADLARLELSAHESDKFLKDLTGILDHFKELESLDTSRVEPMTGGTSLKNVLREDEPMIGGVFAHSDKIVEAFPESEHRYNKIPPVFE